MSTRDKALEDLKAQIREQRTRLDPKLLAMAEQAVRDAMGGGKGAPGKDGIPYDRKAAEQAIETFLKNHPDAAGFRARLLEMIRKTQH